LTSSLLVRRNRSLPRLIGWNFAWPWLIGRNFAWPWLISLRCCLYIAYMRAGMHRNWAL
jgi:hypothetical protein